MSAHKIRLLRVKDPLSEDDGKRYLVDRLYPRGVKKESMGLSAWVKTVGPSNELRKSFSHEAEKFPWFRKEYLEEIHHNPDCYRFFKTVREDLKTSNVTLLFFAKDREHNQAVVLKEWLESKLSEKKGNCSWGNSADPLVRRYHEQRWCKPVHEEKELFALLSLEGMQSGLSWQYILDHEETIRRTCLDLDPSRLALATDAELDRMLAAENMLHNRAKIDALRTNAKAFLALEKEKGSFDRYLWSFTGGKAIDHRYEDEMEVPSSDALSETIAKDLKKRGFLFVGATIIYSYLQAVGIYNDHILTCIYR